MKSAFFALLFLAIGASALALRETRPLPPPTMAAPTVMVPRMALVRRLPPSVPGLVAEAGTLPEPAAIARSSMVTMAPPEELPTMDNAIRRPVAADLPPPPDSAQAQEAASTIVPGSPSEEAPNPSEELLGPSDEQRAHLAELVPDERQRAQIERSLLAIPRDRIDQVLSDMPPPEQLDQMLSDLPPPPR